MFCGQVHQSDVGVLHASESFSLNVIRNKHSLKLNKFSKKYMCFYIGHC